jgi:small-conductance mechanosensitive channel
LFATVLRLADQRLATLLNGKIREDGIVNYTRAGRLRVDVGFTLAHAQDLDRVRDLIADIAASDKRILPSPAEISVEDLTGTGIRVQVAATIQVAANDTAQDFPGVCSDLRVQIAIRFDAESIRLAELPLTCARFPDTRQDRWAKSMNQAKRTRRPALAGWRKVVRRRCAVRRAELRSPCGGAARSST